jgi:hypothetical protein
MTSLDSRRARPRGSSRSIRRGLTAAVAAVLAAVAVAGPLAAGAQVQQPAPAPSAPATPEGPASAMHRIMASCKPGTTADITGHGFVRDAGGTITTIDVPGATTFTLALGTNEAGQTVGAYVDKKGRLHGFLRDPRGAVTPIDFPGAGATVAWKINALGQTVGAYSEDPKHALRRQAPWFPAPRGRLHHDRCPGRCADPTPRHQQPGPDRGRLPRCRRQVPRLPAGRRGLHHNRCSRRHIDQSSRHRRQRPGSRHFVECRQHHYHQRRRPRLPAGRPRFLHPDRRPGHDADLGLRHQQRRPDRGRLPGRAGETAWLSAG